MAVVRALRASGLREGHPHAPVSEAPYTGQIKAHTDNESCPISAASARPKRLAVR